MGQPDMVKVTTEKKKGREHGKGYTFIFIPVATLFDILAMFGRFKYGGRE